MLGPSKDHNAKQRVVDLIEAVQTALHDRLDSDEVVDRALSALSSYPGVRASWIHPYVQYDDSGDTASPAPRPRATHAVLIADPDHGTSTPNACIDDDPSEDAPLTVEHSCPAIDTVLSSGGSLVIDDEIAGCLLCPVVSRCGAPRFEVVAAMERDRKLYGALGIWFDEAAPEPESARVAVEEVAQVIADALARRHLATNPAQATASLDYRTGQLEQIFTYAPMGILEVTLDGRVVRANNAAAEILGYDGGLDLRRRVANVGTDLYADHDARTVLLAKIAADGVVVGYEFEAQKSDGRRVWLRMHSRLHTFRNGSEPTILSFFQDVTELRRRRDEIKNAARANEVLAREIQHRVRNNLSLMLALINLQMHDRPHDDHARDALVSVVSRVRAMAAAHDLAFATDGIQSVRLDLLVERVADGWTEGRSQGSHPVVRVVGLPIIIGADNATTLALALDHALTAISDTYDASTIDVQLETDEHASSVITLDVKPGSVTDGHECVLVDDLLEAMLQQIHGALERVDSHHAEDSTVIRYRLTFDDRAGSRLLHSV